MQEERAKIDVMKAVQVDGVVDGPAKGWIHTHGLHRFGKPELEIRKVPDLFFTAAVRMLNWIADYMLNEATKPVLPGQTMELDPATIVHFEEGHPDDKAGYDTNHYTHQRLIVTARDHDCDACKARKTKAQA